MKTISFAALPIVALVLGCGSGSTAPKPDCAASGAKTTPALATGDLAHRAYVASRDSSNITVIDLDTMSVVGSNDDPCGGGGGYHMTELTSDATKIYASIPGSDAVAVFDARTMEKIATIHVGAEPSHISLSRDGKLLAVVDEKANAVSFVDVARDLEVKRLTGFYTPHFVRFAPDGRYAYVANLGAYHLTRIDLATLSIAGHIALDGYDGPPNATEVTEQVGFADAQIDANGVLWAAQGESGRVLVYDTNAQKKLPEIGAGTRPWIVYAQHPFAGVDAHVVPDHAERKVALLDRLAPTTSIATGEPESYGVNYSPLAPTKAFVMNRLRHEVAIVDTVTHKNEGAIDVGGTTETASTTADGRYIVAAVSSANAVVVIDVQAAKVIKTFTNVGNYPWTVTIPQGQNYCH